MLRVIGSKEESTLTWCVYLSISSSPWSPETQLWLNKLDWPIPCSELEHTPWGRWGPYSWRVLEMIGLGLVLGDYGEGSRKCGLPWIRCCLEAGGILRPDVWIILSWRWEEQREAKNVTGKEVVVTRISQDRRLAGQFCGLDMVDVVISVQAWLQSGLVFVFICLLGFCDAFMWDRRPPAGCECQASPCLPGTAFLSPSIRDIGEAGCPRTGATQWSTWDMVGWGDGSGADTKWLNSGYECDHGHTQTIVSFPASQKNMDPSSPHALPGTLSAQALLPDIFLFILLKAYFHQETSPKSPIPSLG